MGSKGVGDGQLLWAEQIAMDSMNNLYMAEKSGYRVSKFTSDGTFLLQFGSNVSEDGKLVGISDIAISPNAIYAISDVGGITPRVSRFSDSGAFTLKWGEYGSTNGQMSTPYGVAADSEGHVYVADTMNNRIQKFTSDGTFISKWGEFGTGDGQVKNPVGITVDDDGNVYVADSGNRRIQKFTSSGVFISKWGASGSGDGQFSNPWGIATDSEGSVYVADTFNHRIQKFSAKPNPGDLCTDYGWTEPAPLLGSGYCFVTKWGSYGTEAGQFNAPMGVTVGNGGCVYVADSSNSRVQKFAGDGSYLSEWQIPGTINGATMSALRVNINTAGKVYVVDTVENGIKVFEFDRIYPWLTTSTAYVNASLRSTGITTDELTNITAVEYQVGGTGGTWTSCSASDGAFDEKSEEYSCDMTGLADGVYTVYFRSTDSKTNTSTPVSQSITVDTVLPSKPRITSLGLIFGVPNRDDLTYYFSSTTPRIHGRGEAGARVYFEVNGERYGTTVDENGRWYIRIQSPELERDENTITYYQEDDAGNQSATRTLTLIVGAENFPEWLQIGEEVDSGEEEIPEEETPAEEEEPDEDQGEEQTGEYVTIRILDDNGNPIEGAVVTIDGKTYRSDENGNIQVYGLVLGEYDMTVEHGGNSYTRSITIDSSRDVVTIELVKPKISWYWYLLGAIGVIGAFAVVFILIKRSGRAKPYATA